MSRTRADILRDMARLEDELAAMNGCCMCDRQGRARLNFENKEDKLYQLRRELYDIPREANIRAYEYHIISDVELDIDKIIREGIKGIRL